MDEKVIVEIDSPNSANFSGLGLPGATSGKIRPEPASAGSWKKRAQRLQKEAHVFYFVFKHPRTRWYARLLAVCTAGYLLSPIQLIPSFIPVIGFLDDAAVLFLGAKLLKRITPPEVLAQCRQLADAAEIRRKEEIRSTAAVIASIVIATLWFLAAITASALMARHIRH